MIVVYFRIREIAWRFGGRRGTFSQTPKQSKLMETHFPNMDNAHSKLARERVLADMRTLVSDAEDLLKVTASDVSEKARETRARMAVALEKAKASYSEMQTQGIESAKEAARKTDEAIRSHPYEAAGIAFGVGVLIGALLRRK